MRQPLDLLCDSVMIPGARWLAPAEVILECAIPQSFLFPSCTLVSGTVGSARHRSFAGETNDDKWLILGSELQATFSSDECDIS